MQRIDVNNAFLHRRLETNTNIFVKPTQGVTGDIKLGKGLTLKNALYVLKKAAKIWLKVFKDSALSLGFIKKVRGNDFFFRVMFQDTKLWLFVYIADILVMIRFPYSEYMEERVIRI